MVIWIASCRTSSVVDKGMSMRRQIFGSSSCSSMRSLAIRSITAPFRRSSLPPTRLMPGIGYRQPSLSGRASRGQNLPIDHGGRSVYACFARMVVRACTKPANTSIVRNFSSFRRNKAIRPSSYRKPSNSNSWPRLAFHGPIIGYKSLIGNLAFAVSGPQNSITHAISHTFADSIKLNEAQKARLCFNLVLKGSILHLISA